jgi:hypothetical protein
VHTDYNLDRQVSLVSTDGIPAATLPTYDAVKGRLTSLAFIGGTDILRVRSRKRAAQLDRHRRRDHPELRLRGPAAQDRHLGGTHRGERHPHLPCGLPPRHRDGRRRLPGQLPVDNDGFLSVTEAFQPFGIAGGPVVVRAI